MYLGPKLQQIIFPRRHHKSLYEMFELLAGTLIIPLIILIQAGI